MGLYILQNDLLNTLLRWDTLYIIATKKSSCFIISDLFCFLFHDEHDYFFLSLLQNLMM